MDHINRVVSSNLKKIRKERGLSLDQLAKMTDVSKSMLSQIERGVVVPTISTVWKITSGLGISFAEIVEQSNENLSIVRVTDMEPVLSTDGKYKNFPLFKDEEKNFEVYYIELAPGAENIAGPHEPGTVEYIVIYSGTLTLEIDGDVRKINNEEAIRFRADVPHIYRNEAGEGGEPCRLSMIMVYV
ncbi:MAG: XRE family transcriptional regulator [Anaerovoracaceae bacterium]|nr:XRE family transcriptional regulator [Anaerovoracaceae bacterium]